MLRGVSICISFIIVLVVLCSLVRSSSSSTPSSSSSFKWPQLPTGSYQIREGSLLSQQWKVATINFDVLKEGKGGGEGRREEDEEELHFPLVVPCFECVDKRNFKRNDEGEVCVCNFASTDEKVCGTAPKGCPKETCLPSEVEERCDKARHPWEELRVSSSSSSSRGQTKNKNKDKEDRKEGVTSYSNSEKNNFKMSLNEVAYFRFHSSDPCLGYKVKVHYTSGLVDLHISRKFQEPDELSQEWSTSSRQYPDLTEVDLCPEFLNYGLGTFYVAVVARTEKPVFKLSLYFQEATIDDPEKEKEEGKEEEVRCEGNSTMACLTPGVPLTFNHTQAQFRLSFFRLDFSVKKGECKTITVYVQVDRGDAGISGSFTKLPNLFDGSNPPLQSELPGSDIHHIQRCFEEDNDKATYYIGLYLWSEGHFTLRASFKKTAFLIPTSELTPYQYAFSATRTLIANCPGTANNRWMCQDWKSYCRQFWLTYPAEDPHPFWPPPGMWRSISSPVSAAMFSSLVDFETPLERKKPGSLSLVMVLSHTIFGKETSYITEEELEKCTFQSTYTARNKKGYALQGTAQVVPKYQECNQKDLDPIVELGRSYLDEMRRAKSFDRLLQLAFQVNSLMFSSPWIACNDRANRLLDSTKKEETMLTTACFADPDSTEFAEDPCCNPQLLSCCAPRKQTFSVTLFNQVDKEVVDSCSSPRCVSSYASDLLIQNNNQIQCSTFSSDQYPSLVERSEQFYIQCKGKYNIDALALGEAICHSDEDCTFGGVKSPCNHITKRCIMTREVEIETVRCIIDGMDLYTAYYFKERLHLRGTKDDDDFLEEFIKKVSSYDCRNDFGHQEHLRHSKLFAVIDSKCADIYNCEAQSCLDTTCEITPTGCVVFCQMNWLDLESIQDTCEGTKKCNWLSESCSSSSDCEASCELRESESFCGYCEDDAHCVEIPQITSKKECVGLEACLLPNGKLEFLSKKECEERQSCSQPCYESLSCKSTVDDICVSINGDKSSCFSGEWREDLQLCIHPLLSQTLCESAGYSYLTCDSLSLSQCGECYDGSPSCPLELQPLQCHVVPTSKCDSERQCTSRGGFCDDALFYKDFGFPEDDFGACLSPVLRAEWAGVLPYCESVPVITPQGCINGSYTSKAQCASTYHELARSKEDCLKEQGCATYDQLRVLSSLTDKECKDCGKESKPYFRWTPGWWVVGKPVSLTWRKREVVPLYQWKPAVDFEKIQTILRSSISDTVLSDLRSQSLCDFNARSEILKVVSCSCGNNTIDDKNEECFSRSLEAVESGSGRACIGLGSTVQNVMSLVEVPDSAVLSDAEQRCTTITLFTVSYLSLEQPKQLPFSPLTKVRDYDGFNVVLNEDHAIVGRVMSDGVIIELDGDLESYVVCLQESAYASNSNTKFKVYDLGVFRNGRREFLEPMGLKKEEEFSDSKNLQEAFCFNVEKPKQKETYFLILRQEHYRKVDGSLYGSEAIAWWIFAALYVILGLFCLTAVLLYFFDYKMHLYFVGLFGFLAVMCVIRSVYFFLLASRVFDDSSESWIVYFLIEFPTLLYVSSFSCLATFWVQLYMHLKGFSSRWIHFICLGFNLVLYVIFVVLLILYQTLSENDEKKSECPNRVPDENDNSTQQTISIFYQSFMAGASLILGMVVLFFGFKLFLGLKKMRLEGKVALMTILCATGLLLHCSLILYLSVRLNFHFVITVIMIVLSELVPILAITLQFFSYLKNAISKKQKKRNVKSRSHVTSSSSPMRNVPSSTQTSSDTPSIVSASDC